MKETSSRSVALIYRLLLVFLVFSLCRVAFFVFNVSYLRHNGAFAILKSFLLGIWFDTVPVFYYLLPLLLLHVIPHPWWKKRIFQRVLFGYFVLATFVICFQNIPDCAYFHFNKKRTGAEIFQISEDWDLAQSISYVSDFWYLFPVCFVILGIAYKLWHTTQYYFLSSQIAISRSSVPLWAGHIFVWSAVTFMGLRGGWGLIPLRTFDAGRYVNTSLVPLTISTPFQFICTIEGKSAPSFHFMSPHEADSSLQTTKHSPSGFFKKKNIVIIIVESLGKEYLGFYNNGLGYTPFVDSLCQHSLTFENSFANGTTSMDAPPAIFSGIPFFMDENYIISHFNTNTPASIGSLLEKKGYTSSFYHGGRNGTMSFDNFVSLSGMGDYYGMDQYPYPEDFDGKWGIADEPYLQYYAEQLNSKKQPFLSSVFTLSSHHPYTVPDKYKKVLPKGTMPIHQSIAYTDMALRKFFQKAKKASWYKNTLFVITADHTSDSDKPAYQTLIGRFSIPIILFDPSSTSLKGISKEPMQQSLILPTVFDLLQYDLPYFSLGRSPLGEGGSFAVFYNSGFYILVEKKYALLMGPTGKCTLHDYHQDPNLSIAITDIQEKERLEKLLKSYLQSTLYHLQNNSFGTNSTQKE